MLTYLNFGRNKAKARIKGLSESTAFVRCNFGGPAVNVAELMIYEMRHVQHHAAQLNLSLRQEADFGSKWVSKGKG